MKLAKVGIKVQGRKAYCYSLISFLCSYEEDRALMMSLHDAQTAANWLLYMMPNVEVFTEEIEAEEKVIGSTPKDCPGCDSGHCKEHEQ